MSVYQAIQNTIATRFSKLGILKRFFTALKDYLGKTRTTYAQQAEGLWAWDFLQKKCPNEKWFYIDIGANHPSTISNTYKFCRAGLAGITIEPFIELFRLHKLFQKRDIQLPIACGGYNGLQAFSVSKTPVLSSLKEMASDNTLKKYYIPVLTLDSIMKGINTHRINFSSINM